MWEPEPVGRPRVAIIDDDGWVRRGRVAALGDEGVEVVLSLEHRDALEADDASWEGVEVALVDAKDKRADFDLYVGVKVVEHLRRVGPRDLTIVVVTGHVLDDVLRLRMAEAGADWLYGHADVRTPEDLVAIVRDPGQGAVAPPADPEALREAGLSPDARPNAALSYLDERGLAEAVAGASQGESQKALPVGRRRLIAARERLASLLGTTPTDPRAATPEWRRLVTVIDRVRGRSGPPAAR
jgi:CheY-like chemotaxis protein